MTEENKSFWVTLPGILTGTAGLIAALVTLLTTLNQLGIIGSNTGTPKAQPEPSQVVEGQPATPRTVPQQSQAPQPVQNEEPASAEQGRSPTEDDRALEKWRKENIKWTKVPDISGNWQGTSGESYVIVQTGPRFTIQEFNVLGMMTAQGQGVVAGRDIDVSFATATGATGTAKFRLSDDGRQMIGTGGSVLLNLRR
jgi:hypothetical protein